MNPLLQDIKKQLTYDAETGSFARISGHFSGKRVGTVSSNGYLQIWVCHRRFLAHRLAWLWVTGSMPSFQIDHIDGDRLNNRAINLRDVPCSMNAQNRRKAMAGSKSGVLGVRSIGARWRATISVNGKHVSLGTFDTKELARDAYLSSKRILHPGCSV